MELICLCCLTETSQTFKITTRCEFRAEECYDSIFQGSEKIHLSDLYSQLTQLNVPQKVVPGTTNQLMCDDICTRCVGMLKDFYLFRMKAKKANEELQTKANIARIINNLEQSSSVGSVWPEQTDEGLEQDILDNSDDAELNHSLANKNSRPFSCPICHKMFKWRKLLKRHEEIHSSEKRYRCPHCDKGFLAKASCNNHERKVHRKHPKAVGVKLTLAKEKKTKGSTFELDLKVNHEETAGSSSKCDQQNVFLCDLCEKKFTRKSSLNHHKEVLHAGIRQYSCQVCNRAFGKADSLNTHLALHFGKKHLCKLCGKTFAKGNFLRKHLEQHEMPEERRKYTCSVCSKGFTMKGHLRDHELIHSDKRPHKCNVCGHSFRQKQQLKIHSYQHFGKPFHCAHCNSEYSSRTRLQAHINKHHPKHDHIGTSKPSSTVLADATNTNAHVGPDFGDNVVNEEILNEICYQINSNPIVLQNIENNSGVNLINSEQIVFLADDGNNVLPVAKV